MWPQPLALVRTSGRKVAALPVAIRAAVGPASCSTGGLLGALKARGVGFATITHAAGISSTGDAALDARLPFDEPYRVPARRCGHRADAARGGRVVALGTTVTRALEHARRARPLRAGDGSPTSASARHAAAVVDAIVSGTHEPGTSHYELLRAFASDAVLRARARAGAARLPHARVRRLGAGRARRVQGLRRRHRAGHRRGRGMTEIPMAPPIQRIDHIHVFVSDRAAARRWYADVLGFAVVPELEHWASDGGPLTIADATGAVHLALFERPARPHRSTIALGVSREAFLAWEQHLGTSLGQAPDRVDHGAAWSVYFSDPDGNPYEITCYL
jgi:catechol 2,3-dioxygenase-like lactoylglutathione lyase family enzyme